MKRLPIAALRPFVAMLWSVDRAEADELALPRREHVLPTGMAHLVFRLSDSPLRVFASSDDREGQAIGGATVGGVRSRFYLREMSGASASVGAVLRPGAAWPLFGASADEVAERHSALEHFWGNAARRIVDRLRETDGDDARLACLESILLARLPQLRAMHPGVAHVIDRIDTLPSVEAAVCSSGLSHRHFIDQFRQTVGLTPKRYLRILRFQHALRSIERRGPRRWSWIAMEAGYGDQSHFNRDFVEFTGVTPTRYDELRPVEANHLPVVDRADGRSIMSKTRVGRRATIGAVDIEPE